MPAMRRCLPLCTSTAARTGLATSGPIRQKPKCSRVVVTRSFNPIIEVLADDPYAAQAVISKISIVGSVTQLGIRLRVLVPESAGDALGLVENELARSNVSAKTQIAKASLEDVFVAVTLKPEQLAA